MPRKKKSDSYHGEEDSNEAVDNGPDEGAVTADPLKAPDNGEVTSIAEIKPKRGRPKKIKAKVPDKLIAAAAQMPLIIGARVYAANGILIHYRAEDTQAVIDAAIEVCNYYEIRIHPLIGLGTAYANAIIAAGKVPIPKPEAAKQPDGGEKSPTPEVQRQPADSGSGAKGAGKDGADSGVSRAA
jgi:hypothetical protein